MNVRTLFSRLVSALSALAILNQVLTPDQLNLLNSIHPKASAVITGLAVIGLVTTEASVKVDRVVGAVRGKKTGEEGSDA